MDSSLQCTVELESLWESLCVTLRTEVIETSSLFAFKAMSKSKVSNSTKIEVDLGACFFSSRRTHKSQIE